MSLNSIFDSINSKVATVNSIVNSINTPQMDLINDYLDTVNRCLLPIRYENFNNIWEYAHLVGYTLYHLGLSYKELVDEYYDSILSIKSAVDRSFSDYYDLITYEMESAIQTTWNEINNSETRIDNRISQVESDIILRLEDEIDANESILTDMVNTLEAQTGLQLSDLLNTVTTTASAIYDYISETTSEIYNKVNVWIDELWEYVRSFMEWVTGEFKAYYNTVRQWIIDKSIEIYKHVAVVAKELALLIEDAVSTAWRYANNVKKALMTELSNLDIALRSLVAKGVNEVKSALTEISLVTDWRFQFLNIFMSYPELSFLQVLTRDEVLFQKYKPYWQALFARVLTDES